MTDPQVAESAAGTSPDPLAAVADAMQAAAETVSQGAATARDAAGKALPQAGLFANRFLYTTSYAVAYGVVFPMAVIALSVPQNNPFVHGLIDGSRAARNKVDSILSGAATSEAAE
ncbi:MAG: hypothetical protein RLZZ440_822 [Planctomycetota bacterium]